MSAWALASIHVLRPGPCRRSYTLHRGYCPVCLLRGIVRDNGRGGHSTPSRSDARGCAWRFPAGVSAFRTSVSDREHPCGIALALKLRVGSVLHRDCARCALAGRRLARDLVQGPGYWCHWNNLLFACMAQHASNAGERLIDEKVVPKINELSNSFSDAKGIRPHSSRPSAGDVSGSTTHTAIAALRIRPERKGIEPPARNSRRQQDAGKPGADRNLE